MGASDQVLLLLPCRRVASVTQSTQNEAQSCSPFGKKKKCKDKYLAKHSSSKSPFLVTSSQFLSAQDWSLHLHVAGWET